MTPSDRIAAELEDDDYQPQPKVTGAPERIFLNIGDCDGEDVAFHDCAEVTWCEDRQFDLDVEYVRLDLFTAACDERDSLKVKHDNCVKWALGMDEANDKLQDENESLKARVSELGTIATDERKVSEALNAERVAAIEQRDEARKRVADLERERVTAASKIIAVAASLARRETSQNVAKLEERSGRTLGVRALRKAVEEDEETAALLAIELRKAVDMLWGKKVGEL